MKEEIIAKVNEFLTEKVDPELIVLFGSYATGNVHPKSDIDIAFYRKEHTLSAYDIFILAQELAGLLHIEKVDLIDLNEASTVFKMQIFSKGEAVLVKNEHEFRKYEMSVYRLYADLNEKRGEVLAKIYERGRVYGS